ncbi:MAG TPA: DoxX family protein [Ignavibacteria bacterium]|nr:DoxX family protein [Ignavibacteria bacterium]
MKNFLFSVKSFSADFGLLVMRVSLSLVLILMHGLPKFENYGVISQRFFDPIGFGPATALSLSIFAELFCASLVVLGFMTRLSTLVIVINLSVAFFGFHYFDPFAKKELAFIFMMMYFTLFILGPGRISIDGAINRPKGSKS